MVKRVLVEGSLAAGLEVLQALDRADLSISVALWFYSDEHEDWRFVLASRRLDEAGPRGPYRLIHRALEDAGIPVEHHPTLWVMRMSDPFIRALRRYFAKTKNVEGVRLGPQSMGDRFVEDALVYRVR